METKLGYPKDREMDYHLQDRNIQSPFGFLKPQERQLNFLEALQVYYCIDDLCQSLKTIQQLFSKDLLVKDQKLQRLLFKHKKLQKLLNSDHNIPLLIIKEDTLLENNFQQNVTTIGNDQNKIELAFSLRNILRYIKQNRSNGPLYSISNDPGVVDVENNFCKLQSVAEKLKHIIHEKLLTTSKEELIKQAIIEQKRQNLTRFNLQIVQLENIYVEREKETEDAVEDKITQIEKMYEKLEEIKTKSAEEISKCITDSEKIISTEKKMSDIKQTRYSEEIHEVKDKLEKQRKEHFQHETILRKKKFKMATELGNWIQKYDQDMGSRQDVIEELTIEHEQDLQNLAELQSHFIDLEKQYNVVIGEKRIEEEKRERKRQEMLLKNDAATVIQATWRGYAVRGQFKSKKKKKGKGGKKGKKGKK